MCYYNNGNKAKEAKDMQTHDPVKFRELLIEAISGRTQAEFAKASGILAPQINRYLRKDYNSRPSMANLQKIAAASGKEDMLQRLEKACGYTETEAEKRLSLSMKERAEFNARDLRTGFSEFTKAGPCIYSSVEEYVDAVVMLYCTEEITQIEIGRKKEYEGNKYHGAEYQAAGRICFANKIEKCDTWFSIYYAETRGGNCVITGASMLPKAVYDAGGLSDKAYEKYKDKEFVYAVTFVDGIKDPKTLLSRIFGEFEIDESKEYPLPYIGFGFYLPEFPENFRKFLFDHKDSFCSIEGNKELFNKAKDTENLKELFSDFSGRDALGSGYEAVIAEIMSIETDLPFVFFDPRKDEYPENIPCIMIPDAVSPFGDIDEEYSLDILCEVCSTYAKELDLKEFGEVHIVTKNHTLKKNIFTVQKGDK